MSPWDVLRCEQRQKPQEKSAEVTIEVPPGDPIAPPQLVEVSGESMVDRPVVPQPDAPSPEPSPSANEPLRRAEMRAEAEAQEKSAEVTIEVPPGDPIAPPQLVEVSGESMVDRPIVPQPDAPSPEPSPSANEPLRRAEMQAEAEAQEKSAEVTVEVPPGDPIAPPQLVEVSGESMVDRPIVPQPDAPSPEPSPSANEPLRRAEMRAEAEAQEKSAQVTIEVPPGDPIAPPQLVEVCVESMVDRPIVPQPDAPSPKPSPFANEPLRRAEMRAEAAAGPRMSVAVTPPGVDAEAQTSICLGAEVYIPGSPTELHKDTEPLEMEHPPLDEQLKEMCALIQANPRCWDVSGGIL